MLIKLFLSGILFAISFSWLCMYLDAKSDKRIEKIINDHTNIDNHEIKD